MLIYIDDTGRCAVASIEGFAEEPLGGLGITLGTQQKIQGTPVLVHGSIQPSASTFDLHIDFIDSPSMTGWTQIPTAALVQLRSISLDPPVDGRTVNPQAPFCTQFFHIPVAEGTNAHSEG